MLNETLIAESQQPTVAEIAEAHLREHQLSIWKRTDHLLGGLLVFEWIAIVLLAAWRSPLTWAGPKSHIHPHLIAAIFAGAAFTLIPVAMAIFCAGSRLTRHAIAIAQMLMSALLIDVGDGRVEMHFHIFGALAFLAFYRDWRVLVTATIVTALDHFILGIYSPQSIYGVYSASMWRTLEHSGWVVFEDIFLIGSCVRGVHEMRGIAHSRALLEHSYFEVEKKVQERTSELKAAQHDLLKTARSAGMAEIATSVLHNVGNVLNSVNISATIVADKLRQSEVPSLGKVSQMMIDHKPDLGVFLTEDQRGQMIPGFLTELATCLGHEQSEMLAELTNLNKGIDHIKQIVAAQQSMAKKSNLDSLVDPMSIFDTAWSMQSNTSGNDVELLKEFAPGPMALLDQHKVLQILINLISNAHHAVKVRPLGKRQISLVLQRTETRLIYKVIDNGTGIAKENLSRIFSHGFTTKSEGHGFGLHSAANAAREMSGSLSATSEGPNKGASFILEIPFQAAQEKVTCKE